jgi:signal transduction histidine kinase
MQPLYDLLSPEGFPPRWTCGQWSPALGWTHIISDLAIWAAYFTIPAVILYYMAKKRDVPFPRVLWLFAAFIFACGSGHLVEAIIFWHPLYRLDAVIKVATAITSWLTVLALIQIVPIALTLPGLAKLNSQLEIANRDLADTNRDLDAFAAVASHDLKAPLRGIRALVNWIQDDPTTLSAKQGDLLKQVDERITRMQVMIDGILRYSRASRQEVVPAQIHTGDAILTAVAALHIPEGIHVEVVKPMPTIWCDAVMFQQIIQNLVANALTSFDTPKGTITIAASQEPGFHVFDVSDTGRGIPLHSQENIFRMFNTTPSSEALGSTGVGLSIVKRLVERFGGSVNVNSSSEAGSTFRVRLPV